MIDLGLEPLDVAELPEPAPLTGPPSVGPAALIPANRPADSTRQGLDATTALRRPSLVDDADGR